MHNRFWMLLASATGLLALCSVAIHPFGRVKATRSDAPLMDGAITDPEVLKLVNTSCRNCHSEATTWPWYSYVAPMSWLVEKDVSDARKHMNLSRWSQYSQEDKEGLLIGMNLLLRSRQMPPSRYLALHKEARLNDEEVQTISRWVRAERRRIRQLASPPPGVLPNASQ